MPSTFFRELLWIAEKRGYKRGWAVVAYIERHGEKPGWDCYGEPVKPSLATREVVRELLYDVKMRKEKQKKIDKRNNTWKLTTLKRGSQIS